MIKNKGVYDTEMKPLLEGIMKLCSEHGIPYAMQFNLNFDNAENDEHYMAMCTSNAVHLFGKTCPSISHVQQAMCQVHDRPPK